MTARKQWKAAKARLACQRRQKKPRPCKLRCRNPILEPILNKAAELANVAPEQLVMVRAESVVWNDGSLGCPAPGMDYTQALINGLDSSRSSR